MCSGLVGVVDGRIHRTCLRNVVDAAGVPWVAAQQAPGGEPRTAQDAEPLDGGQRVGGARRVEPAGRRPHR